MACEERLRTIDRNGKSKLNEKLSTPASRDNGIKTDIVVVFVVVCKTVFCLSPTSSTRKRHTVTTYAIHFIHLIYVNIVYLVSLS